VPDRESVATRSPTRAAALAAACSSAWSARSMPAVAAARRSFVGLVDRAVDPGRDDRHRGPGRRQLAGEAG
jgi:hypothetical protein